MEGEGGEHLAGDLPLQQLVRPQGHIAVKLLHAPLAPGHGSPKGTLVHLPARLLLHKSDHLPELVGYIVHRRLDGLVGHVHHELGHLEVLRQPAEGEQVGVAGQGGVQDEPGLRHEPLLRRADEDPVVGTEGVGQALALGVL